MIEGVRYDRRTAHADDRGSFRQWFGDITASQVCCSFSRRAVVRGIHVTQVPPGQAKYVACASGRIWDVAVDLRAGSPTFGEWAAERLDQDTVAYLPPGVGHGWMALGNAVMVYLMTEPYRPDLEVVVNPFDPEIGIDWTPFGWASDRDRSAPSMREALDRGLLPAYAACAPDGQAFPITRPETL